MLDYDGHFTYSRIAYIEQNDAGFYLYPNPVDGGEELRLSMGDQKAAAVKVFDVTGKLVYQSKGPSDHFSFGRLPPGRYIVKVLLTNGREISHPVVKK